MGRVDQREKGLSFFSFLSGGGTQESSELPDIFPLSLQPTVFTKSDIVFTYLKILTDAMERTHGLPNELHPLLWDNCVQSDTSEGLISLLACAMAYQADLYLVYASSVKVIRKATSDEQKAIKADYQKAGKSSVGVFISFKNYRRTELLEVYSTFEYCVLGSLNKTLNLAKAVQIKISDLRGSVALVDAEVAKSQAMTIAKSLARGKDIYLDAKDMVETAKVDTTPTENAIGFIDAKRAFILGMPLAYISGEQTGGIGTTGEADMRAVERGLKQYWMAILRPALLAIFGKETEFKTQDFRQVTSAIELLKTFDLVSNEFLSTDSKRDILARMFDLDADQELKAIKKEEKLNQGNGNGDPVPPKVDAQKNSPGTPGQEARH